MFQVKSPFVVNTSLQLTGSVGEKRECIVCLRSMPPGKGEGESYITNEDNFKRILSILKVTLTPFNYNFQTEGFPFCGNCSKWVYELIDLHAQLDGIKIIINKRFRDIRTKLRESEQGTTSGPGDVRAVIFRGQIMAQGPPEPDPLGTTTETSKFVPSVTVSSPIVTSSPPKRGGSARRGRKLQQQSQGYQQLCNQGAYSMPVLQAVSVEPESSIPASTASMEPDIAIPTLTVSEDEFKKLLCTESVDCPSPETIIADAVAGIPEPDDVAAHETVYEQNDYYDERDDDDDEDQDDVGVGDNGSGSDYVPPDEEVKHKVFSSFEDDKKVKLRVTIKKEKPERKNRKTSSRSRKRGSNEKSSSRRSKEKSEKSRRRRTPYKRPEGVKPRLNTGVRIPILTTDDGREFIQEIELVAIPGGIECGACGESFFESANKSKPPKYFLKEHIRGVHLGLYKCLECNKSFQQSCQLSLHNRREHIEGRKPCTVCGRPLAHYSVAWHMWLHMNAEEQAKAEAAGLKPPGKSRTKSMCGICGKIFCSVSVMKVHEQTHEVDETGDNRTLPCPQCGKKYSTDLQVKRHLRAYHSGAPPRLIPCLSCDMKFADRSTLNVHKLTHLKLQELPENCSICFRRFATRNAASWHERRVHKDENSNNPDLYIYPCDLCGQKFRIQKSATDHRSRVHRDVPRPKPERKDHCSIVVDLVEDIDDQNEENKNPLTSYDIETGEEGELSFRKIGITKIKGGYECGRCHEKIIHKTKTPQDYEIKEHINAYHYGAYRCSICQKYRMSAVSLRRHVKRHNTSLTCYVCGKPDMKQMYRHIWTHKSKEEQKTIMELQEYWKVPREIRLHNGISGVKSWFCNKCEEVFPTSLTLTKHRRKSHPNLYSSSSKRRWSRRQNSRSRPCPKSKKPKMEEYYLSDSDLSEELEDQESDLSEAEMELSDSENSGSEMEMGSESESDRKPRPSSSRLSRSKSPKKSLQRQPVTATKLGAQNAVSLKSDDNGPLTETVSLIKLPDSICYGKNFTIFGGNELTYITSSGSSRKISMLDLDVGLSSSELRNKLKNHYEIIYSGTSDQEDDDSS